MLASNRRPPILAGAGGSGSAAPSGPAGGDLSGTYPNPSVVNDSHDHTGVTLSGITDVSIAAANKDGAAGTPSMRTLGTTALTACAGNDSRLHALSSALPQALGTAAAGTTGEASDAGHVHALPTASDLGLGTAATATAGPALPAVSGGIASSVLIQGRTIELCSAGAIANLITSAPADWVLGNTAQLTAARAADGTVTLTRSGVGTDDRASLTFPYIGAAFATRNATIVGRISVAGDTNFRGGGICHHVGTSTACSFAGWFTWQTSLTAWDNRVGNVSSLVSTQSAFYWYMLEVRGGIVEYYYSTSTSTSQPTSKGATAASQWVRTGYTPLVYATAVPGQNAAPVSALYICPQTGGAAGAYTVVATTFNVTWY